jgi:hypothetical protein
MDKKEDLKITLNKQEWQPKGLLGKYFEVCCTGLGSGAMIGSMAGATAGFTVAALSPALIGYGLVRGARILLRK